MSINRTTGILSKHFNLLKKEQFIDDLFMIFLYFTGVFNITSDNLTISNSTICDTKNRQSKGINTIMLVIIGLAVVSFIIYMMYCYARVLENRHSNTSSV